MDSANRPDLSYLLSILRDYILSPAPQSLPTCTSRISPCVTTRERRCTRAWTTPSSVTWWTPCQSGTVPAYLSACGNVISDCTRHWEIFTRYLRVQRFLCCYEFGLLHNANRMFGLDNTERSVVDPNTHYCIILIRMLSILLTNRQIFSLLWKKCCKSDMQNFRAE